MIRHCKILLVIQLRRILKVHQRRSGAQAISMLFKGAVVCLLSGLMSFALAIGGAASLIPAFLVSMASMFIFFFSIAYVPNTIFETKDYDLLMSMPIKTQAIAVSRFLAVYAGNLLLSALIMLTGCVVYIWFEGINPSFMLMSLFSTLLLPLIPMLIAVLIGAVIAVVSSRFKASKIISIVLQLLITFTIAIFWSFSSTMMNTAKLGSIAEMITQQVSSYYPLAPLLINAFVNNDWLSFIAFAGISFILFMLAAAIFAWKYRDICAAFSLRTTRLVKAKHAAVQHSPLKALYFKELKRYFSSSVYVVNTSLSHILMLLLSIALIVIGVDRAEELLNMPGVIKRSVPFLLGFLTFIGSTAACSITMEGRQWWIPCTMPLSSRTVFNSKLLVDLTLSVPVCLISSLLVAIAARPNAAETIWLFLLPLSYNLFAAVMGLNADAHSPGLDWENEAEAVKKSSGMIMLAIIGMIIAFIPFVFALNSNGSFMNLFCALIVIMLLTLTWLIYKGLTRLRLINIEQDKDF